MQRFLIITANGALLALLVIGLPAATRAHLGNVQFSSATTGRLVLFWGLGLAGAVNMAAGLFVIKRGRQKVLCWEWAAIFAALLLAEYGFTQGWFNFKWLTHGLEWLQHHL